MRKVIQRLIVFFVGIPVILLIVHIPILNHLPFNIALLTASAIAAYELCLIFNSSGKTLPSPILIFLSTLILICEYLDLVFLSQLDFGFGLHLCQIAFLLSIFVIFSFEIFTSKKFEKSNTRIAYSLFIILYAGFFPSFIMRITSLQNSSAYLTTFLVLVFISDSAAWLFGVLLGKNNRGKIAASPNKSIAGFLGAYFGCILIAYLFAYVFFSRAFSANYKALKVFVLAVVLCTASIVGDLAESVFKRSANVKDSGKVMLGRGGMLDSVDSIFLAAPFFYFLITILFA